MIKYSRIISKIFEKFFEENNFQITEATNDLIEFKSKNLSIKFFKNSYSYEYTFFISHECLDVEIDDKMLKEFLVVKRNHIFSDNSQEKKIENWAIEQLEFFEKNKVQLFSGEKDFFQKLNVYFNKKTEEYNKKFSH